MTKINKNYCYSASAGNQPVDAVPEHHDPEPAAPAPEEETQIQTPELRPEPDQDPPIIPPPAPAPRAETQIPAPTRSETPYIWYEFGEMDKDPNTGRDFRWIKADQCPGQKRITGKMTERQKLEIASENKRIRQEAQDMLRVNHNINIQYYGRNTPMGVPGNGNYDAENLRHQLAIIKVGVTRRTNLQLELERRIHEDETRRPLAAPETPTEIRKPTIIKITVKEKTFDYWMYKDTQQLTAYALENNNNLFQVKKQPVKDIINIEQRDTNMVWNALNNEAPELTYDEYSSVYSRFVDDFNKARHEETWVNPIGQ